MAVFARFRTPEGIFYGLVEGESIRQLAGSLLEPPQPTGKIRKRSEVQLLAPCVPPKILAVGLNYKSHLGDRKAPEQPEIFYKPVSALQDPDGPIILPPDAEDPHFEGELVAVVGKQLRHASREEAEAAVFGVTCGNDVSDRNWQRGAGKDVQWWRAKGCDTFSPLGPVIVTGLNYSDLLLQTRLNGEVLQNQRTNDLLRDIPDVLRYISRYVTVAPGDVVYTGTPGNTKRMKPGDVVEVEIEGIGILRNSVRAA